MAAVESEILDGIKDRIGKCEKGIERHDERICKIENQCASHQPLLAAIAEDIKELKTKTSKRVDAVIQSVLTTLAVAFVMWLLNKGG